jgi:hypothetical protein
MSTAELAVSYAALILADDGVDITVCRSPIPTKKIKNKMARLWGASTESDARRRKRRRNTVDNNAKGTRIVKSPHF